MQYLIWKGVIDAQIVEWNYPYAFQGIKHQIDLITFVKMSLKFCVNAVKSGPVGTK